MDSREAVAADIHHASRAEATAHRRAGSLLASAARPAYPFVTTKAPRKDPSLAGRTAGMKDVKRAWQRMLSGRRLDLLDPSPLDIELEDIAHGLARVARWNGQRSEEHTSELQSLMRITYAD